MMIEAIAMAIQIQPGIFAGLESPFAFNIFATVVAKFLRQDFAFFFDIIFCHCFGF